MPPYWEKGTRGIRQEASEEGCATDYYFFSIDINVYFKERNGNKLFRGARVDMITLLSVSKSNLKNAHNFKKIR